MPLVHPLEPLAAAEVADAVRALPTFPDRHAAAVLFDNGLNTAYDAVVNLISGTVVSVQSAPPGSQPTMSIDEQAVLASPEFKAALKKHYGIEDTSLVMADTWSAGNYGKEEDRTRGLARPLCFLRSDPTDNGYARPIEGIRPVVGLNRMGVIRVPNQRRDIKPLVITHDEGPSFQLDGNHMSWQNWKVVIGFNAREGLTLQASATPIKAATGPFFIAPRSPKWLFPMATRPPPRCAKTPSTAANTAWARAPPACASVAIVSTSTASSGTSTRTAISSSK
jgi:hypothetical protein